MKAEDEALTRRIIGAAIAVHRELGPGLLESAYEVCLHRALLGEGLAVERQVELPIHFRGEALDAGYRLDLVVERRVVIELKAVERVLPLHEAQLLTYLKLSGYPIGLLINFNVTKLVEGITRRVVGYNE